MTPFFILFGMKEKWPFLNYAFHLYWDKIKTFGIFTAHWLWIMEHWFIFRSPWYATVSNIIRFLILFGMKEKWPFWIMHFTCTETRSRHLEFLQLTDYEWWKTNLISRSPWYAIVLNIFHFLILFGTRENGLFWLCMSPVLRQDQNIWNFYSSLTLNNGKLISDVLEALTMPLCQIWSIFYSVWHERKHWPVLNFVFYLSPYFTFHLPFYTVKSILEFW